MKRLIFGFATLALMLSACQTMTKTEDAVSFTSYVDPYIGTDYHGHVFLGANVPFGGVHLGPVNITFGWDWTSGYHYSDSTVIGFSHTRLSGTGIGDLSDIVFMPTVGETPTFKGTTKDQASGYLSTFYRENEVVEPGYYSVLLNKYNIGVELTTTERGAVHKYKYPANSENVTIIVDLESGNGWDAPTECYLKKIGDNKIEGHRLSTGWAKDQRVFFVAEFSEPIESIEYHDEKGKINADKSTRLKAFIRFKNAGSEGKEILSRMALSPVSVQGAESNFAAEVKGRTFEDVRVDADKKWNTFLSKIELEGKNEADKRAFYTALYHTAFAPQTFNDVTGDYRGADGKLYNSPSTVYTVYSLWDTYRAAHPLLTITAPERVGEIVNNLVEIAEQQGKVPVWHLMGSENNCMVGFHSIPVIVDAYLKGFEGFDAERAFKVISDYANLDERGLNYVRTNEYIPAEKEGESVAKALEYCIDDWAVAQMAKRMGKTEEYEYFKKRSENYKHYFDKNRGFMRGKLSNGKWNEPFDPVQSTHRKDDYCEGNAWQYTWLVPHDVEGLIGLFGSDELFVTKLDSLFTISSDIGGHSSPDISGLVGQYAQGNEPNHSTPFLYNYAGQQWKTAAMTRHIMRTFFTDAPDGLCGNEDCGQMSAWYVFTAMGFYPANATSGAFLISSPLFDEVTINVDEDKTFKVIAENNSEENIYVQSATLNGEPHTKTFITYKDVMAGGELKLIMGATPNKEYGASVEDRPQSMVY
ncbi:MAG: GH92 family glycosyl hydrolase [Rikenellaceae bacterium]